MTIRPNHKQARVLAHLDQAGAPISLAEVAGLLDQADMVEILPVLAERRWATLASADALDITPLGRDALASYRELSGEPPVKPVRTIAEAISITVNPGVDDSLPGLFELRIDGATIHIDRYVTVPRKLQEIGRHAQRILDDKPWTTANPHGHPAHYHAVALAYVGARRIEFVVVENADRDTALRRVAERAARQGVADA